MILLRDLYGTPPNGTVFLSGVTKQALSTFVDMTQASFADVQAHPERFTPGQQYQRQVRARQRVYARAFGSFSWAALGSPAPPASRAAHVEVQVPKGLAGGRAPGVRLVSSCSEFVHTLGSHDASSVAVCWWSTRQRPDGMDHRVRVCVRVCVFPSPAQVLIFATSLNFMRNALFSGTSSLAALGAFTSGLAPALNVSLNEAANVTVTWSVRAPVCAYVHVFVCVCTCKRTLLESCAECVCGFVCTLL